MSHNNLEIMNPLKMLKELVSGVIDLFTYTPTEPPLPVTVDPWIKYREELPAKLEWARSIDVSAIAEKAGSSIETVERLSGYPGDWIRFGAAVQSESRLTLTQIIQLESGMHCNDELKNWFKSYMHSSSGYGSIELEEDHKPTPSFMSIIRRLDLLETYMHLIKTQHLYFTIQDMLGGQYDTSDHLKRICHETLDRIMKEESGCCYTLEQKLAFFGGNSLRTCQQPFWRCTCDYYRSAGEEIYATFKRMIADAKTKEEARAIKLPSSLYYDSHDHALWLERDRQKRIQDIESAIRAREIAAEEQRVKEALGQK